MRFSQSAVLAFAAAAASVTVVRASAEASTEATGPSDVLVLGQDNFTASVDKEDLILVEFYAPWCGHCQALAPHYEKAATELKGQNIKLAKVDCVDQADLCGQHDVGGYPTLKVFRKGEPTMYNGPRKTEGIVSYMKKQSLPAITTLTADELTDFQKKDRVVVISYLTESDAADKTTYSKVAEKHRDSYLFGVSTDPKAAEAAGVKAPAVVVYRTFDEPTATFTSPSKSKSFKLEEIEAFVKSESIPLIDEVGPDNFQDYADSGLPLAYFFTEPESKTREADLEKLKTVAKAAKGKINFVWIDAVKFVNHARGLNIQGDSWPAFAIQDLDKGTKYPLENLGKDVGKTVGDFVKKFTAGSLQPSIKSEPIPSKQDGPVHVLVADEFDKVTGDSKKDLLVEFYAPWCGHCKKLAPIYDELGEKYSSHKDKLVIAKMDATTNDIPPSAGFTVQSFPTIKFRPAGSKEWVDFDGARTVDGFVDFIALNGKNKIDFNTTGGAADKTTEAEKPKAAPAAHEHEEL